MVDLLPFNAESPLLSLAARIYAATWNRTADESRQYFQQYARFPYFYGLIAVIENRVVGTAFGVQSLPGHWWHNKVAQRVGRSHLALQHAWVLVELAVLPGYRNRHTGSALHDRILELQPFPNVLLSTQVGNYRARRFYEQRDWHLLHRGFAFHPGSLDYVVMHRRLER
jgi:ribosomal protein S18 acetylase RimI-like enzyme